MPESQKKTLLSLRFYYSKNYQKTTIFQGKKKIPKPKMPPKGSKVKASPNKGKVVAKPAKKPAAKTKTAAPKRVPTKRGQTSYSKHCEKKVLETVNEHYKCKEKKLPLQLQAAVCTSPAH